VKHDKQRSLTEEDDPALNVKPMEPILRGYKRSIIVPQHRTIPSDLGILIYFRFSVPIYHLEP